MTGLLLASLLWTTGGCAYLRVPGWPPPTCTPGSGLARTPRTGAGTPDCEVGLPPRGRRLVLASGRVCVGGHPYERVPAAVFASPGPPAPLPEAAVIERLCRAPVPTADRRRWWHPVITVSAERGLRWSPGERGFSEATTVWVSLSFPLPGPGALAAPLRPDRSALCAAAARLGRTFARVGEVGLRDRARLQLMAWRDELSSD